MTGSHYLHAVQQFYKFCAATKCFQRVAGACRVETVKEGNVVVEFDVAEEYTNPFGTLHGGYTATLVDIVTTSALMATPQGLPGVSVDLHISYLGPAKIGDTVVLDAKVVKSGKRMAFTNAELRRKTDGALIATGVHTKAFPSSK